MYDLNDILEVSGDHYHDVVWSATGLELTRAQLIALWQHLPASVTDEAQQYTFLDTPTRDRLYTELETHKARYLSLLEPEAAPHNETPDDQTD